MSDEVRRYVVGTLKGGPGKTTTAWHLLHGLAFMGHNVLGICADRASQGLIDNYRLAIKRDGRVPFRVLQLPADVDVYAYAKEYEQGLGATRVVIDVGGEDMLRFQRACLYADQLVSPVGPQRGELRRMPATYDEAMKVAALHEFDMAVLLTRVPQIGAGAAIDARHTLAEAKFDQAHPREFYVLHAEVRRSHAWYGTAWGQKLKDLHDYSYVVDELEREYTKTYEEVYDL